MTTETPQQRIARLEREKQALLADYDESNYYDADRIAVMRWIETKLAETWELERQRRATAHA